MLTGDDDIFDIAPPPEPKSLKLFQLLWNCEQLVIETRKYLKGTPRKIVMHRLWEVITNIMETISTQAKAASATHKAKAAPAAPLGDSASSDEIVDFWAKQVQEVRNYYVHSAEKRGLEYYLLGTIFGVVVTASVYFLKPTNIWVAAFISGAAGGAVSILSRMIREELIVSYDAGEKLIILGGFFRPIVGGVLGTIIYAAVIGGLIPLTIPIESEKALACYSVVAFVGGLAERWAQDTLVQSVGAKGEANNKGETI